MEPENNLNSGPLMQAALAYAGRGWAVFPLSPKSKIPFARSAGYKEATTSLEVIKARWTEHPDANIGIATGKVSGMFAVDLDDEEAGIAAWADLCRKNGSGPLETLSARTVSGGRHLIFKYPAGEVILRCGVRKVPHIDTRGDGGYIVAAPSYVEDDKHEPPRKGFYSWVDEATPLAEMPAWLIALYNKVQAPAAPPVFAVPQGLPNNVSISRAETLLEKYLDLAATGNRNDNGFQLAAQLRDNGIPESEAQGVMLRYADSVPQAGGTYTRQEALRSLNTAYRAAPREPSFRPPYVPPPAAKQSSSADLAIIALAPPDQEGHFQVFRELYGEVACFTRELGWLAYDVGFWIREVANTFISVWITDVLRKRAEAGVLGRNAVLVKKSEASRSNLEAVKAIAQDRLLKKFSDFNTQPELLNCKNGVLNLRTLELFPHSPFYLFDYKLDVNWNPEADTLEWNQFAAECVGEAVTDFDGEKLSALELLQLCAGYSITGDTSAETLFYIFGPPRSGKGTFMTAIQNLLGPLASTVNIGTLSASSKGGSQNFELAGLSRCRYITVAETGRDTYLEAGRIKNLTGNDPIQCAFKFKDTFRYTPSFKIWISSNHEINVDSSDDAVWDRLRAFHFSNSHKEAPNTSLKTRLTTNLEPVLLWCAQGAKQWYRKVAQGLPMPRTLEMKKYLEERKDEADYIKQFLEDEELTPGKNDDNYRAVQKLYDRYHSFCDGNRVSNPLSSRNFTSELKRRGFVYKQKKCDGKNTRVFLVTEWYRPSPIEEDDP